MPKITKADVEHVADLARLELTSEEKEKLVHDLDQILEYVNKLQEMDTAGADLNFTAVKPVNQKREDKSSDSGIQEAILDQAPKRKDKYFEVKAILE